MKILVVDDDVITGTLLKKILTKNGFEVIHVADGIQAIEIIKENKIRIILTDWMMPEMDGPTLCRHIREMNLPQSIYIIILTAKSAEEDAVFGLDSGADDYIVKPFNHYELLARIRAGGRHLELEDAKHDAQQKLSHSEKIAAIGYLAAGVAHEINNPIGFIGSNLNSLKNYMNDFEAIIVCYRKLVDTINISISQGSMHTNLPSLVKKTTHMENEFDVDFLIKDTAALINDCSEGVSRISSIVHEMRYFAHPEKQVFQLCNLDEILDKAVKEFLSILPSGVTLKKMVADSLPEIECNAQHIEQALVKIIQNAIDAVGTEGMVTIKGNQQNNNVQIKISDTGPGIAPEDLDMVFDAFFTTKAIGQGIGLGLTTAMNIIRMHNGSIKCESDQGRGACFTIRLPMAYSNT